MPIFHICGELTLEKIIALTHYLDKRAVMPDRTLAVDEQELRDLIASYSASMSPGNGWLEPSFVSVSTLHGFKFFRTDLHPEKSLTKVETFDI